MNKLAALVMIVVFLVFGSVILSAILMPVSVQAAPQATPPAKPDLPGEDTPLEDVAQPPLYQTSPTIPISEQAMVIVQLDAPPLATVFQSAYQETNSLSAAIESMKAERQTQDALRQSLIAQLTAPPFNARIISATSIASNTLIIEVNVGLIPQIRELPGVLSVAIDHIGQLDDQDNQTESSLPASPDLPDNQPSLGPVLD